jgi:hypothetical protein
MPSYSKDSQWKNKASQSAEQVANMLKEIIGATRM